MMTEWKEQQRLFQAHGIRAVEAAFDGGMITSAGGALLLRELAWKPHIVADFARCVTDHRANLIAQIDVLENHCLCQSCLFRFSCYLVQSAGGISFQSRVAKTWVK